MVFEVKRGNLLFFQKLVLNDPGLRETILIPNGASS